MKTQTIPIKKLQTNNGQIDGLPKNPRFIRDERFERLKQSIKDLPSMLELRELIVYPQNGHYVTIGGNMRLRAARDLGLSDMPCKVLDAATDTNILAEIAIKDNVGFGQDDFDVLANEWTDFPLTEWGLEIPELIDGTDSFSLPDGDRAPFQQMTFTVSDEQAEIIMAALDRAKKAAPFVDTDNENSNGNALARIAESYV